MLERGHHRNTDTSAPSVLPHWLLSPTSSGTAGKTSEPKKPGGQVESCQLR